jgi:hypothetical protein
MRPALDPAGHRVPRTKPTCLVYTWRPHRRRPFALVLHLHQHQSSRNLHLQYLAKNQSTQRCQSLITQGSNHPPVLEPHMVLIEPRPHRAVTAAMDSRGSLRRRRLTTPPLVQLPQQIVLYRCVMAVGSAPRPIPAASHRRRAPPRRQGPHCKPGTLFKVFSVK